MAMTLVAREREIREKGMALVQEQIGATGEEILQVGPNEFAVPCVDSEGNETCYLVKVSVPRGTRNGNGTYTPYDPYEAAESYKLEVAEKAEKKQAAAAKKAAKIAADKAKREAKAAKEEE